MQLKVALMQVEAKPVTGKEKFELFKKIERAKLRIRESGGKPWAATRRSSGG
jgi:hypothetical protein